MILKDQFGVLLVNLGTPDEANPKAIRRYLSQFLSDRHVVDTHPLIWYPILYGIILPLRAPRLARLYKKIWLEQGSPLLVYSKRQQQALLKRLIDVPVELAMTYGSPSIMDSLSKLYEQNLDTVVVLPLYPQYSSTTTAAVWSALVNAAVEFMDSHVNKKRKLPEIRFVRDYADHPNYISALVKSIEDSFDQYGKPDLLIFSYHGIPKRYADQGDEYPTRCELTTQRVIEKLALSSDEYLMSYQSHFGKQEWLKPYTDQVMKRLPAKGIKHVQVICPGFSVDCLETIEEIEVENKKLFIKAGGEQFHYIPALNDTSEHIDLMLSLIKEKLAN